MSDLPPRIERHEAFDRFGKTSLRAVHDLTTALSESGGSDGDEPVVVRTDGAHRTLDGLAALIDAALTEHDAGAAEHDAASDASGPVSGG